MRLSLITAYSDTGMVTACTGTGGVKSLYDHSGMVTAPFWYGHYPYQNSDAQEAYFSQVREWYLKNMAYPGTGLFSAWVP